jgi:hypothetical protein
MVLHCAAVLATASGLDSRAAQLLPGYQLALVLLGIKPVLHLYIVAVSAALLVCGDFFLQREVGIRVLPARPRRESRIGPEQDSSYSDPRPRRLWRISLLGWIRSPSVDGTLIEAWAAQKSFKKKDDSTKPPDDAGKPDDPGNPTVNFHGEKLANQTHPSTTDPDALLFKKGPGKEAKLSYCGHVTMEHRNGLVVAAVLTQATGKAEREAALEMIGQIKRGDRITLAGDKGYDVREFVGKLRGMNVTPHIAQRKFSAIDGRTTRHPGYEISQRTRKRAEEIFGWVKTVGTLRKTRHRGRRRVGWMFTSAAACYNLVRMKNLMAEAS